MSVLIKGMEMPTSCDKCWALDDYGDYPRCRITEEQRGYNFRIREKRMDKCPLIPVPEHGRLIDADALMLKILDYIEEYSDVDEKGWHNLKRCAMKEAEMAINDAPTIIEVEGEE